LQSGLHLCRNHVGRIRLEQPQASAKDVDDRQVRNRAPIGDAVTLEVLDPARLEALPELVKEPRLPHAGLAEDAHDSPTPRFDLGQKLPQHRQLELSADEATERDSTDLESTPLVTDHAIDRFDLADHL
jgi:hypothetical protein